MNNLTTQREQVLELARSGLANVAIAERLHVDPKAIGRLRRREGLAPVARSAYRRAPHPRADDIRLHLTEGHTNAEISRRTGADTHTIAQMRQESEIGPPTILPTPRPRTLRAHPRDAEIRQLLATRSNNQISRRTGAHRSVVARIRAEVGITWVRPQQWGSATEKWAAHLRPVGDGHLEWTGDRDTTGTPRLRFDRQTLSPMVVAFRWATGRDPEGVTYSECGHEHCVSPAHVDDRPGRARVREQLRYLHGQSAPPTHCQRGHDQAQHGRYGTTGWTYCQGCRTNNRKTT